MLSLMAAGSPSIHVMNTGEEKVVIRRRCAHALSLISRCLNIACVMRGWVSMSASENLCRAGLQTSKPTCDLFRFSKKKLNIGFGEKGARVFMKNVPLEDISSTRGQ